MKIYTALLSETSDSEFERGYAMMSEARKKAVLRYRGEKDRKRTVLGEMLARRGISEARGISERDIIFGRHDSGKPFAKNVDIEFNISHSKDMVVCAVSDDKIGIDVEFIRDMDMRITKIACTERDKEYIFGCKDADIESIVPDEAMILRFFRLWTAKEAFFKYNGSGIVGLKKVDYSDIEPYCEAHLEGGYIITTYMLKN